MDNQATQTSTSKTDSTDSVVLDPFNLTQFTQLSHDHTSSIINSREISPLPSPPLSPTSSAISWASLNSFGSTSADVRAADKVFDKIEDLLSKLSQDPLQHRLHCRIPLYCNVPSNDHFIHVHVVSDRKKSRRENLVSFLFVCLFLSISLSVFL